MKKVYISKSNFADEALVNDVRRRLDGSFEVKEYIKGTSYQRELITNCDMIFFITAPEYIIGRGQYDEIKRSSHLSQFLVIFNQQILLVSPIKRIDIIDEKNWQKTARVIFSEDEVIDINSVLKPF